MQKSRSTQVTIAPAMLFSLAGIIFNTAFLLYGIFNAILAPILISATLEAIISLIGNFLLTMFLFGVLTTITEWKKIGCSTEKKLLYMFTFPFFILTYIPISLVALYKKVEWKPISHTITKSISDIKAS
jgi:hypothetical protein